MQIEHSPIATTGAAAADEIRSVIRNIRIDYHRGAMQYDSMSIKARRSMTRRYAVERWYCAALFQFHSDAADFNRTNWTTLGIAPVEKRELPMAELCPVGRKWFTSLFEAEELLEEFVHTGHSNALLPRLRARVEHAQASLRQAQDWLKFITLVEDEVENHSIQAITEGWNIMTTALKDPQVDAAVAAINANVYMTTRPKIAMERFNTPSWGKRSWVEYEMEMPQ